MQYCPNAFRPESISCGVASSGFFSDPRIVTLRLIAPMIAVSAFPGWRALHPVISSITAIENEARQFRKNMTLLHHRDRHVHAAVIHATEMVANCRIGSWGVRRKCDVYALTRLDRFVNLQLSHEEAMCHVLALQTE